MKGQNRKWVTKLQSLVPPAMSGREMFNILAERNFPASEVVALASSRSVGREVSFGDKILKCKNLEDFDFTGTDFVLMSAGGEISKHGRPRSARPAPS